jgi:hypothetical protein
MEPRPAERDPKLLPVDERISAGEGRPSSVTRTSTWDALLLFLLDRSKYREYRFDREMFRAMQPITRAATNTSEQSFVDMRLRGIDALEGLVAPTPAWAEVRESIVGVLRYEIDVVHGKSPVDIEEHRSRSAPFVARLEQLRRGYRSRSRAETTDPGTHP